MTTILRKSVRTFAQIGEALGIHNLDPESGKIFITDGTGVIGHRVALKLLNAGYPSVRLGTSMPPESLSSMNEMGAEIADFNWVNPDTYMKALQNIKSVLITIPYIERWHDYFDAFVEACKLAGVKHIIKISFFHARVKDDDRFRDVPFVQRHGICDRHLIQTVKPEPPLKGLIGGDVTAVGSGMDMYIRPNMSYTILYTSHYMSDPFTFQGTELRSNDKQGTLYGATKNHGVNHVSPNDVADFAVRVLLAPREHYDKEYTLTGPGTITDNEIANLLSKYLHKPIVYIDQPITQFAAELKLSGIPKFMVEDMVAFERVKASGKEEDHAFESDDIEKICGHEPETFEDYLRSTDSMIEVEMGPPVDDIVPLKEVVSN